MRKVTNMRKITKKIVAVSLAMGLFATTGCGGSTVAPGGNEKVTDDSMTQLTVATFDGGIGVEWLENAAARFEEAHKDTSFEEGKKGVQVTILCSSNYNGSGIVSIVKDEQADVWFTENASYGENVAAGNFADITDIVTEKLTEYGEEKSIADKMESGYRDYLNLGTEESPEFYGIPFFDAFYGLTYDKELFAKENLYLKSSGTEAGDAADVLEFIASDSDKKSAGVDGKLGTYDDGLPATHAQFLSVLDKMKEKGITPLIYGGSNAMEYTMRLIAAFWAQAEGEENYKLNTTLNGVATDLVKLDADGKMVWNGQQPALETLNITAENAYDLQRQVGKYYVLELFDTIMADTENYTDSNLLHSAAQSDFLKGKEEQFDTYGFLIDGIWTENEASESFKALANRFGDEYLKENRDLGFMPLPVAKSEDVGRKGVLMNATTSIAFVRSTTEIMDCAKAFLQFTTTDKELSLFTSKLSITRSFDYDISDEVLNEMSSFGRSVYELKKASYIDYGLSTDPIFMDNASYFSIPNWAMATKIDGSNYTNPWQFWRSYSGQYSAQDYFEGLYVNQKGVWEYLVN